MSDQFQARPFYHQLPDLTLRGTPLPAWVARRVLKPNEHVTWVYGPRFNPSWERFATHPGLFLAALGFGVIGVLVAWLFTEDSPQVRGAVVVAAGGLTVASVLVLGIACGYFTRLVVTDFRLVILQGYEVCSSWGIDHLPATLVRYSKLSGGLESRTIDLSALQTMLGSSSDQIADSRTILAFGKQLDRIRSRDNRDR